MSTLAARKQRIRSSRPRRQGKTLYQMINGGTYKKVAAVALLLLLIGAPCYLCYLTTLLSVGPK